MACFGVVKEMKAKIKELEDYKKEKEDEDEEEDKKTNQEIKESLNVLQENFQQLMKGNFKGATPQQAKEADTPRVTKDPLKEK